MRPGVKTRFPGEVARWCPSLDYTNEGTTTLADLRGSNNGTLTGGPTWVDDAQKGGRKAISFDGTNDYVLVADASAIRFDSGSQDFAISAWIYRDTAGNVDHIFDKRDANDDGYLLYVDSDNVLKASIDTIDLTGSATLGASTWYHVALVVDRSGNAQLYVNGATDGSTAAISGEVMATTAALRIGGDCVGSNYFDGLIDDARLFSSILSASEVLELYQGGRGYERAVPLYGGEVGAWIPSLARLGEGSLPDLSGNGNTGTLIDGPIWVGDDERNGERAIEFIGGQVDRVATGFQPDGLMNWTVSLWMKANSTPIRYLFGAFQTVTASFYSTAQNGTVSIYIGDGTYNRSIQKTGAYVINEWTHIAFSLSGTTLKVYVNGAVGNQSTIIWTGPISCPLDFLIGNMNFNGSILQQSFDGTIDDLRLYDRALTDADLEELYMRGRAGSRLKALPGTLAWYSPSLDYRADGAGSTLYDLSGNGHDGTITGAAWTADTGEQGIRCLDFDGVDDRVYASNAESFTKLNEITFAAWINIQGAHESNLGFIGSASSNIGLYDWLIYINTDKLTFSASYDTNDGLWQHAVAVPTAQWVHVAASYKWGSFSNDAILYIDGQEVAVTETSAPSGSRWSLTNVTLEIGNSPFTSRTFNGLIDDVVILDHAASIAEIRELASRRAYQRKQWQGVGGRSDERLWLPVSGNIQGTTTLIDVSGKSNHGTLTNMDPATDYVADTSAGGSVALDFDGTDDYVTVTDNTQIDLGSGDFTLTVWFQRRLDGGPIVSKGKYQSGQGYWYLHIGGSNQIAFTEGTSQRLSTGTVCYQSTGLWHFVTVTRESGNYTLRGWRSDGVTYSATGTSLNTLDNTAPLRIATDSDGVSPLDILTDEVRLYGHALPLASQEELASYRASEPTSFNQLFGLGSHAPDPDLQLRLDMQETAGTTAEDLSGRNHDGTTSGATVNQTGPNAFLTKAYDFDGTNDTIDCGDLALASQQGAMGCWVSHDGTIASSATEIALSVADAGNANDENVSIGIYNSGGTVYAYFEVQDGTTTYYSHRGSDALTASTFYHIAVVKDANQTPRLYVDGVLQTLTAVGSPSVDTTKWWDDLTDTDSLTVGARDINVMSDYFDGKIAQPFLVADSLTEQEINEVMGGPEPLCTAAPVHSGTPQVGTAFTPTNSTWSAQAGDSVSQEYQWWISNDSYGSAMTPIIGATSGSYTPVGSDEGKYLLRVDRGVGSVSGYDAFEDSDTGWSAVVAAASSAAVIHYVNRRRITV